MTIDFQLLHGGNDEEGNLAWSCFICNRYKGSDIASLDPQTEQLTPLFNPRTQQWHEHFCYEEGVIVPLTPEGRTTVVLLRLNEPARIQERIALGVNTQQA